MWLKHTRVAVQLSKWTESGRVLRGGRLEYFYITLPKPAAWDRVVQRSSHGGGNRWKAAGEDTGKGESSFKKRQFHFWGQNLGWVSLGGASSWVALIQASESPGKINYWSYSCFVYHLRCLQKRSSSSQVQQLWSITFCPQTLVIRGNCESQVWRVSHHGSTFLC